MLIMSLVCRTATPDCYAGLPAGRPRLMKNVQCAAGGCKMKEKSKWLGKRNSIIMMF